MEVILTFFTEFVFLGSVWLFWILTGIFFSILFGAEKEASWKTCFITLGIGLFVFWKWTNVPVENLFSWRNTISYIVIGFTFALLRTYIFGKKRKGDDNGKDELKSKIAIWWFFFPISLLSWIFSDLVVDIYNTVYNFCAGLFEKIYSLGEPKSADE